MEPATLGLFTLAALAIVLTPGPDTMIILRHSLVSGRGVGLAAVLGVQLGLLVHTLLAVLGVSLLIASSPRLFQAIAVAGGLYLGWLGIQGFRRGALAAPGAESRPAGRGRALRQALLTNLLNPKVILLFLALFPGFVDRGRTDTAAQLLTLAAVLIVINTLWQAPLALAATALRVRLADPRVQRLIGRATGAVFIGFGALMLYENLGR